MRKVTLHDGREVDSSSEEWRAECEARHILSMSQEKRAEFFQDVERKRGADATKALKLRCYELEPHYVLNLPNRAQRNSYVDAVERRFGPNPAEALRIKVRDLHAAQVAKRDAAAA